jgi:hypothetical protein
MPTAAGPFAGLRGGPVSYPGFVERAWWYWLAIRREQLGHEFQSKNESPDVTSSLLSLLLEKETLDAKGAEYHPSLDALQIKRGGRQRLFRGVIPNPEKQHSKGEDNVPLIESHRRIFYRQFYTATTAFVRSELYKEWQREGKLPLRKLLGRYAPEWALRNGKRGAVPDEPIPFPGVLLNGFADRQIWMGFRPLRFFPTNNQGFPLLDQLTAEQRAALLQRDPTRGNIATVEVTQIPWMQDAESTFDLRGRLAAIRGESPELCRAAIAYLMARGGRDGVIACGPSDFIEEALGNIPAGRSIVLYLPYLDSVEGLLAAITEASRHVPESDAKRVILCTNLDGTTVVDALKQLDLPATLREHDWLVFGYEALRAALSQKPWLWTGYDFGPEGLQVAQTYQPHHVKSLFQDPEFPFLHYGVEHPAIRNVKLAPGVNARIVGGEGAGKTIACQQLLLRDLAPTTVFLFTKTVTANDVALASAIATDLVERTKAHLTFCVDSLQNVINLEVIANDLMLLVTRLRERFGPDKVTMLVSYTPFRRETIEREFPAWFEKHRFQPAIHLGGDEHFLGEVTAHHFLAFGFHFPVPHRIHAFAQFVHGWNGSIRTLFRLLRTFRSRDLDVEQIPHDMLVRETNQAWYDQYMELCARSPHVAGILEIIAYFRILRGRDIPRVLLYHYFYHFFSTNPTDWQTATRVLHDAGWVTFDEHALDMHDVNIRPQLTGLLSTLTTADRVRDYDLFTLSGPNGLPMGLWGLALSFLARGFVERDERELALFAVARLEKFFPTDPNTPWLKTLALAINEHFDQAFATAKDYLDQKPDDFRLWFELASACRRRRNEERARLANKAGMTAMMARGGIPKGVTHLNMMHNDDILNSLEAILQKSPQDFETVMMLLTQYVVSGCLDKALTLASTLPSWDWVRPELRALEAHQDVNSFAACVVASAVWGLSYCVRDPNGFTRMPDGERFSEDIAFYRHVAEQLRPFAPDAADLLLGEQLSRVGLSTEAEPHLRGVFDRYTEVRATFTAVHERLMRLYAGDPAKVLSVTAEVTDETNMTGGAYLVRGLVALQTGRCAEAERDFRLLADAITDNPCGVKFNYDDVYLGLARAIWAQDRDEEALQWLDRIADQRNPIVLAQRGLMLVTGGRHAEGEAALLAANTSWALPDQMRAAVGSMLYELGCVEGINTLWGVKARMPSLIEPDQLMTSDSPLKEHPSVRVLAQSAA